MLRSHRPFSKYGWLAAATGALSLLSSLIIPSSTETAAANGDTRTLYLYHSHTGESIEATFRLNGVYDPAVLEKLNYFLRDWRNNDVTRMDPRLFDVVWEAYRMAGATTQPIVIISAYRSPQTNAMLRRRSHGVAEHSQHILGKAMDTTMPGMPMERIREIGMRLQRGGVGWYPSSNFVHLDVGGVRSWPRMSYDQLVRLFPDGKTVHLAADGRALPRYAEARAEIAARGAVMSDVASADPAPVGKFFAWLFGKHGEDDEDAGGAQPQGSQPQRGRHGAVNLAALHTKSASMGGAPPGAQILPANGGTLWPTATPVQAKYAATTTAGADRTHLANLGTTPGPQSAAANEQNRDQVRTREAAANPKEKIDMRVPPAVPEPVPPVRPDDFETAGAPANVPLPPVRPASAGAGAVAFADVPTPPVRPPGLARAAKAEGDNAQGQDHRLQGNPAIAAATAGNLLARAASLPVLITVGPKDSVSVPKQVLAFASEPSVQASRAIAPGKTPDETARMDPSQLPATASPPGTERRRASGLSHAVSAAFSGQSMIGQPLIGLRRAARTIPDILSNRPSTQYASSFGAAASELDVSHFSGAAVTPPGLAQGFVRITQGTLHAHEN